MFGDKSKEKATVNMYRVKDTKFVHCHDSDNHEYLYKIQEDGLLQDGIYRYKFPDGETIIGCRLFWRGDRQENKEFRLYKSSSDGEIRYQESVSGKENPGWRIVTEYKFHPETMSWSKLK